MKVLYILHTNSAIQGSTISILNTIQGLISFGIVPIVMMPYSNCSNELVKKLKELNVTIQFYKFVWPHKPKTIVSFLKFFVRKLIAVLRISFYVSKYRPTIIHSNVGILQEGNIVSRLFGIPHVWHLREFQDLDFHLDTIYTIAAFKRKLKREGNFPIGISHEIANHFGLDKKVVIYNGVMDKVNTRLIHAKENYILFVGQLSHHKGIETLIHAFSSLNGHQPDYRLKIIGATNDLCYQEYLQNLVLSYSLAGQVDFLGGLGQIQVYDLMAKAKVLVVPSFYEAFGRTTVEGIFNGCYVIGRNTGGTKEVLSAVGGGRLFNEEADLSPVLKNVLESNYENIIPELGKAQELSIELFSNERNVEQILSYYKEALINKK